MMMARGASQACLGHDDGAWGKSGLPGALGLPGACATAWLGASFASALALRKSKGLREALLLQALLLEQLLLQQVQRR